MTIDTVCKLPLRQSLRQRLTTDLVPRGLTHLFLIINVLAMTISSIAIIVRKHSEYAVGGLVGVVITQALGYGLIFDLNFFLRNLSVVGGLLMVLSDSWVRKKFAPAGLPQLDEKDRKMYIQLAGRVLLIFLFLGFVVAGEWSIWRVAVSLLGFVACIMVVVGFKAKFSAIMLVLILSVFNILVNNFWTVSPSYSFLEIELTRISCTPITPTRTSPSTTFSRSCPLCKQFPTHVLANTDSSQRWSPPPCQHGPRPIQCRRKEEGLLVDPRMTFAYLKSENISRPTTQNMFALKPE